MLKHLRQLVEDANAVVLDNEKFQPEGEMMPGDIPLGILPDDIKKLWVVVRRRSDKLSKECDKIHGTLKVLAAKAPTAVTEKDKELIQQHTALHSRQEVLSEVFWQAVKEAFPQTFILPGSIGLRKGWQVVITNDPHQIDVVLGMGGLLLSILGR